MNRKKLAVLIVLVLALSAMSVIVSYAWTSSPVKDDPLVRLPGTQPGQVTLENPNRCFNCHADYNSEVEPGFNWRGSMMAQSARDFLYFTAVTVAAQDAIWAVGNANATDICLRCHFPKGWLEGRSDVTNASLMTGADYDGVQCDFCHTMWDPFFEETHAGTREGNDWLNYWDETNNSGTPAGPAADATYAEDKVLSQGIQLFNGDPFFVNNVPLSANYTESTSGQFFISPNSDKRASFADASARHQMLYSRFHKSKYMCATCHDVSNPVLANLGQDGTQPLTTETEFAGSYFHVERTFSEFMLSDYGQQGGAAGMGPFDPAVYETSYANNYIAKCQDCHMRDVTGVAANKRGTINRPNESVEHPESGQPLHDLTGGNVWVSTVLASAIAGSPNYDATNDQLLNQGPTALTLDLSQGLGIDPQAMLAGADRARQQLLLAASIDNVAYDGATGSLSFRVQNQTGHKLTSGFPEGRRIFVNIKAYAGGSLIHEVNPYDYAIGTLKGLPHTLSSPALGPNEVYVDELVYEMHPSSSLTGEAETLHFVLADDRYKDNRIPPKGFRIAEASERLVQPRWHGQDAFDNYSAAEYAGGYDDVTMSIPPGADAVEINLYYQTTSREYIEFLRDEINGVSNLTLYGPDNPIGDFTNTFAYNAGLNPDNDNAYLIQSDPFFSGLKGWGDTIWQLWTHNMNVDGAKPFLMTQATVGDPGGGCTAPTPNLTDAIAGNQQVQLTWTEVPDPSIAGYKLYYDQAGKAQLVADINTVPFNTYTDAGLTNGQEYCYKVTTYYDATCESGFSNILCATPQNQGQTTDPAGVDMLETGKWTGKGQNAQFVTTDLFAAGDAIVVRAYVADQLGNPIANATVEITIGGPEAVTLNSNPSAADGWAEATWQTQKPNKKGQGGTAPGGYTASTTNVTVSGYHWDGITTAATFTVE